MIAAGMMVTILAASNIFANGGIIVSDATERSKSCTETKSDWGIIVSDVIGIIVSDFGGIIVSDLGGIIVSDAADNSETCGIIVSD